MTCPCTGTPPCWVCQDLDGPSDAQKRPDELIEALVEARADGATHITGLSGNYRGGARYVRLHADLLWDGDEL